VQSRTKRIRKDAYKRKHKKCSSYGEIVDHDKRTCWSQLVQNGRRQRARDREGSLSDSLPEGSTTDSSLVNGKVEDQFDVEMALYDQRFSRSPLAIRKMEAIQANEPMPMEGIKIGGTIAVGPIIDSDSELSTVSSSRLSGLEDDWWKEKTSSSSGITATAMTTAVEGAEISTATAIAIAIARVTRTRSKGKRVH